MSDTERTLEFWVRKDDLSRHKLVPSTLCSSSALQDGEVLLRVRRFAFTSNNITYAAFGHQMKYWNFFPTGDNRWGNIPVWGFADVENSSSDHVMVGDRYFGYFPMSSYTVLSAGKRDDSGFYDVSAHRSVLPEAYNFYARVNKYGDPWGSEDLQVLCRPLFRTAFLIEDLLSDNDYFDADTVVLSSASSKTSIGLAHLIKMNERAGKATVGLTSESRRRFVSKLSCYDRVITYHELQNESSDRAVVFIDMAGSTQVRKNVHALYQNDLKFSLIVGATHLSEIGGDEGLPGIEPILFFAPDRTAKREREWGAATLRGKLLEKWQRYTKLLECWIELRHIEGLGHVAPLYECVLSGEVRPESGNVVVL